MKQGERLSPLQEKRILESVQTNSEIARNMGISRKAISRFRMEHSITDELRKDIQDSTLSTAELARLYGITPRFVARIRSSGRLPNSPVAGNGETFECMHCKEWFCNRRNRAATHRRLCVTCHEKITADRVAKAALIPVRYKPKMIDGICNGLTSGKHNNNFFSDF